MTPPSGRLDELLIFPYNILSDTASMVVLIQALLTIGAAVFLLAAGEVDPQLTGTWTTKSRKVVTGPVGAP